jgi:ankyrin repeat protein
MDNWYTQEQLHIAVQDGDCDEIRQLIAEGYDVNGFDELSTTPLQYAVEAENLEVAQLLIDLGANVNAHDAAKSGNTALAAVAQTCSLAVAEFLLQCGADPTIPGWMHLSALDRAKERKKPEGVQVYKLLLAHAKKSINIRI